MEEQEDPPQRSTDAIGLIAVIAGVLLLSPVAIVLGHLSLSRAKRAPEQSRTLGLAGTILGYAGLAVVAAGTALYLMVVQPAQASALADAHARADVTAVGNAVAAHFETSSSIPRVLIADSSYTVGSTIVEAQLEGGRTVEIDGTTRIDWCVELAYEGGDDAVVSYVGTDGFQAGSCG